MLDSLGWATLGAELALGIEVSSRDSERLNASSGCCTQTWPLVAQAVQTGAMPASRASMNQAESSRCMALACHAFGRAETSASFSAWQSLARRKAAGS